MKIDTRILRSAFDALVRFLETERGQSISLSHDYYWHLLGRDRLNIDERPTAKAMGQVSDDWDGLRRIVTSESIPEYVGLERLANVLQVIALEGCGNVPPANTEA